MNDHTPTIEGLTVEQKAICEMLWGCDTEEEAEILIAALPPIYRAVARTLAQVIIYECMEPYLDQYEEPAREAIDRCCGC
jgi:hypothetical protein